MLEGQRFLATFSQANLQRVRSEQFRQPLDVAHLAVFDELSGPAGQPLDDVVLELTQLVEIDLRRAEFNAPRGSVFRLVEQLRDVQQGFRRDAAAVDADTTRIHLRVDERDTESEIGRKECGGVASWPTADD